MKPALLALAVLVLVAPAEGQRSHAVDAQQLPTYVTQLGKAHFPLGAAAQWDAGDAVVAVRSGAVIVAGTTYGSLAEPHAGASDARDLFVARFDSLGNVEWIRQIGAITAATIPALNGNPAGPGGDASGWEYSPDIAVAPDESVYVTGTTQSSLGETLAASGDMFLAKFDRHGSLQWLRQLGVETSTALVPGAGVSVDPLLYDGGTSVVIDPAGGVYVGGNARFDVFLAHFSSDGRLEWLRDMGSHQDWESLPHIALHPSGSIVMACTTEFFDLPIWEYYVSVFTLDALGTLLASKNLPKSGYDEVGGLAIDDSTGKIFLAGHTAGSLGETSGGGLDAFLAKFDIDLELEWISQLGETTGAELGIGVESNDHVNGLCIDRDGNLILAGTAYSDVFTSRWSGSDGEVLWLSYVADPMSTAHGLDAAGLETTSDVALGPRGTIVVTGGTRGNLAEANAGESDVFVMRLTPDGEL